MKEVNKIMTSESRVRLHKDQLITLQDLIEFKEQLLFEIKLLLKEQKGEPSQKWLKAFEVKQMLRISDGKLQYLRDQGMIPFKKLGGVTYYDSNEIQDFMNSPKPTKIN